MGKPSLAVVDTGRLENTDCNKDKNEKWPQFTVTLKPIRELKRTHICNEQIFCLIHKAIIKCLKWLLTCPKLEIRLLFLQTHMLDSFQVRFFRYCKFFWVVCNIRRHFFTHFRSPKYNCALHSHLVNKISKQKMLSIVN